jgi:hypothetical protein
VDTPERIRFLKPFMKCPDTVPRESASTTLGLDGEMIPST